MSEKQYKTTQELRQLMDGVPRVPLAHLPTPLEELKRFSEFLSGPRILIKRDDCTGLAFGGNKTRHNEFVFGFARQKGADTVVWGAGVQSNNCRQTAATCAKLGMKCHLVLSRGAEGEEIQGNLLIDHIMGADVEIVDAAIGPELDEVIYRKAKALRDQGRQVFCWDRKLVKSAAAASYVICMIEIVEQCQERGIHPAAIYVCSGGSTGAGLALGRSVLGVDAPLRNITPIRWPWNVQEDLARIANEAADLLHVPTRMSVEEIDISEQYVGEDYGIPTLEGMEAIAALARTEGILLDPSYSGKAMAAVIDHVRRGWYTRDQSIVFVHTGGTPALFSYRDQLLDMLPVTM